MVKKVPSLKGGGAYWFTDLTTPDDLFILPVLASLSFLATAELDMQDGREGNPTAKSLKKFSRFYAVMFVPCTIGFPKGDLDMYCHSPFVGTDSLVLKLAIPGLDGESLPSTSLQPQPELGLSVLHCNRYQN